MTNQEKARVSYTGDYIEVSTNNDGYMWLYQSQYDGPILVTDTGDWRNSISVPAADFVQLLNLYRYTKEHDIQNAWINPNGKNKEV